MRAAPTIVRVKPPALKPGDTVGVIAPASNIKRDLVEAGLNQLRAMGYRTLVLPSIFDEDLYFAGSVERRTRELEEMFARPEVRAVVCARGGYGTNYLLEEIDLERLRSHPKIFVGYSDVTTLLTYFADALGVVTFHGPMVAKDFAHPGGVHLPSWEAALGGSAGWSADTSSTLKVLVEGSAEGILYGGCLSMLVASIGTPYEIHTDGTILFLEDVGVKPFQIDRMLMQLKLSGKLQGVRGIVFGEMLDCMQTKDQPYSLEEVILRVVGDLGVPVACGLRSGHVSRENVTLPIGVGAAFEAGEDGVRLRILEASTAAGEAALTTRGVQNLDRAARRK
ncbi:MAG TPA: LD-carboxypeptidase [Terriglobales bacterium]|nr:LD-carboxypeptidase [Terriglobales bacterium]